MERLLEFERVYSAEYLRELLDFELIQSGGHLDEILSNPMISKVSETIGGAKNINITRVPYQGTDLSKIAAKYRIENGFYVPANIAVVEYVDLGGELQVIVRESVQRRPHSEKVIVNYLNEQNIPGENVKRIYSELEPCELSGAKCKALLSDFAKETEITYTWDYPGDETFGAPLRRFGNAKKMETVLGLKP